jgi:hypothetical protein
MMPDLPVTFIIAIIVSKHLPFGQRGSSQTNLSVLHYGNYNMVTNNTNGRFDII